ncbi:MAG: anaerobic sulfatase maturase [Opitutaceae bacterium]
MTAPAQAPFHLMTKPAGSACNLDCTYCFYLEKEALYRDAGSLRMTPQVLEAYIRDTLAAQPGDEVGFAWQGGEPTLLGVGFYETAVALQSTYARGKRITNALQTNGVLLDDRWGQFLRKHHFLVGISIDGPRHLHDAYRVDKGQRPTFDRVVQGIEVLKRHHVEFNTLTTVHRKNSRQAREVYRFLRDLGSGFLQFIPIVERSAAPDLPDGLRLAPPPSTDPADPLDSEVTPWSVRPVDYGNFLIEVFEEWIKTDVGRVFVQHFDSALASWVGAPAGVCVFSPECGRALAVEHNGDVYSCDHYVYPRYKLGNLMQQDLTTMIDSPQQAAFGRAKSASLPRACLECPVRFACHGECPKHRFLRTPAGEPGLNYLCAGYKRFFAHIDSPLRTMAALLQSGRAPAEIMSLPRQHWIRSPLRFRS